MVLKLISTLLFDSTELMGIIPAALFMAGTWRLLQKSGLDGVMARELFEQLRKIADTGKIVIVITHTPDRVIDLFDDVIVLAKDSARTGRLAWYGSIEDARKFFERDRMEQIVKSVNRKEEGSDGLADEFVMKYAKEVA